MTQHLVADHNKPASGLVDQVFADQEAFLSYKLGLEQDFFCFFRITSAHGRTSLYQCSCDGDHRAVAEPKIARHKPSKLVGRCYAFLRAVQDGSTVKVGSYAYVPRMHLYMLACNQVTGYLEHSHACKLVHRPLPETAKLAILDDHRRGVPPDTIVKNLRREQGKASAS